MVTFALRFIFLPPYINEPRVLREKGKAEGSGKLPLLFNTHHFALINLEAPIGLHNNCAELDVFWMSAFVLRGKHQLRGYTGREGLGREAG